jgi:hypothetical protein
LSCLFTSVLQYRLKELAGLALVWPPKSLLMPGATFTDEMKKILLEFPLRYSIFHDFGTRPEPVPSYALPKNETYI